MTDIAPARRGDLIVVPTRESCTGTRADADGTDDAFTIGVVTNITRDGRVKAYREAGWNLIRRIDLIQWKLLDLVVCDQDGIDVEAALKPAAAHTYPGSTRVRPYDSLDSVQSALRPHLTAAKAS